jgi:hypothetical protein
MRGDEKMFVKKSEIKRRSHGISKKCRFLTVDGRTILKWFLKKGDRLCGLVVRDSGYRSKGPGFDSRSF